MKTIAIDNMKGGVGKTVTAVNIAVLLATEQNKRVLLIDADAQGSATKSLLPEGEYGSLYDVLTLPEVYYPNLIYPSRYRNLDVLPADEGLRNLELNATLDGRRCEIERLRYLRDVLIADDAYDIVIADCPPAYTPPCAAAIMAATDVIIPVKVDRYAVDGMRDLTAQIAGMRRIAPDVHIAGCLVTMWYNTESVVQGEALLREQGSIHVFDTHIRRTPKVDESTWAADPVVIASPRSSAAQDYRSLIREIFGEVS